MGFLEFLEKRRQHYVLAKDRIVRGYDKGDTHELSVVIKELDFLIKSYKGEQ